MTDSAKKNKLRAKSGSTIHKQVLFSFFIALLSWNTFSQDSISFSPDLVEEKELKFQQFFFKALSQKSIGNYQKAIENLESCNQLVPNLLTVFYEFSKNYLELENTLLAKEYINRAIEKDAKNIWMQKHLVKVFVKERNFSKAIKIQQKIIGLDPKEREYLTTLYLQNRDYKSALNLINILENENSLSLKLTRVKERLEKRKKATVKTIKISEDIFKKYEIDKSYIVLKQILNYFKDNPNQLLKYSTEGIRLFPAQPLVYLITGTVLNTKKEYKKALETLKNGADFVIEETMELAFYKEMSIAYKGLGNKKAAEKYRKKSKKLKT